jgi:hypothetical protein
LIKRTLTVGAILATVSSQALSADNSPNVYHYACTGGDTKYYALKVVEELHADRKRNTRSGTIKLMAKNVLGETDTFRLGKGEIETFRIKGLGECGKYGWIAENARYNVVLCTATQGVADVEIKAKGSNRQVFRAECDQADVD